MNSPRVALIDNYDSYTYNLFQLIWEVSGRAPEVFRNDETTADALLRADFTHFVISPGPGTPEQPEDFGLCRDLIARTAVPLLGVCLGHQGLAHVLGGRVHTAPTIMHGRLSAVRHTGIELFAGIPQDFRVVRYHSLAVGAPVPDELEVTARSGDGVVMGLAHRSRPLYGVQFHPESVETEYGARLIANFLDLPAPESARVVDTAPGRVPDDAGAPVPVRWREVMLEATSQELFDALFAAEPYSFWLDSGRPGDGMGRYSFMGAPDASIRLVVRAFAADQIVEEETPQGLNHYAGTIFDYLSDRLSRQVKATAFPAPFVGGFVGFLGYGVKDGVGIGRPGTGRRPDAELLWVDRFLAIDHATGRVFLVTAGLADADADAWLEEMRARVGRLTARGAEHLPPHPVAHDIRFSVDRDKYRAHFHEIQRWLTIGDSYEACYTYQISATCDAEPLDVYRRLRIDNPAPYAAYLRFGSRRVLSSSPERFATVTADRWVETKPIKGTAPRFTDPEEDRRAALALSTEEKTRSENLMIVDLLRNDLGRVCDPGTVHVSKLMAVESYATVHQLVSTISGRLRPEVSTVDCLAALFPGGSMTGAPKMRTVELLDALEPVERGVYSGCLGYFSLNGNADLSIVIRTMVWEGSEVSVGVGGAITALSDADDEYAETQLKARAMLTALGVTDGRSLQSKVGGKR